MNSIQHLLTEHLDIWTAADTEKKTGRGRSSGSVAGVYGIKKLRELILELAVRGKLVPQDTKDEPANELLKRIQAEKTKLISEGKIKKAKLLPPIADEEKPFGLPINWEWTRLGSALLKITDGTHHSPTNIDKGEFKYISAKNIKSYGVDLSEVTYVTREVHDEIYGRCDPELGDLLYIKDGATTGIAAINTLDEPFSMLSSVALLKPSIGVSNTYLLKAMTSPIFYAGMRSEMTGVAITRVTLAKLNSATIPLPPLAEQRLIVAKVDELMALCDQLETQHINATEAHGKLVSFLLGTLTQSQSAADLSDNWQRIAAHFETLFTTEASIDALKKTFLQLAVTGKLVLQDPTDEPSSRAYSKKIDLLESYVRAGKQKIKMKNLDQKETLPELPASWAYFSVDQLYLSNHICDYADGNHGSLYPRKDDFGTEGVIFLTAAQISNSGEIFWNKCPRLNPRKATELSKGWATENDVLFTHNATVGRTAFVDICPEKDFLLGTSVTYYRINRDCIAPSYLYLYFSSATWYHQAELVMKQTTRNQVSITKQALFYIALPPLLEQHRVVAKVEELIPVCDQLKSLLTAANQLQRKLADVMVEQAVA